MSDQKQQQSIETLAEMLNKAQKIAKIGCWDHNHATGKVSWSQEQYRVLGLTPSAAPSLQLFADTIHPEDRIVQQKAYENHIKSGVEYDVEFRLTLTDGTIKHVHSKAETEFNAESGLAIRTIGTCSDITQRQQARIQLEVSKNDLEVLVEDRIEELEMIVEDLKETNVELQSTQSQLVQSEKMASLGVLTAGIAHEINNPVNFIYGGITAVEENLKDVEKVLSAYETLNISNSQEKLPEIALLKDELQLDKVLHFLKRSTINVKTGAERTTEIIKGLRVFSRMDDSAASLSNITECLDNSLLILANQYQERIEIIKEYAKSPRIECYPGKISQVFVNIISNSIQSIRAKGVITIQTQNIKKDSVDHISISFSDTGSGIPESSQSHIFEPFYTTKEVGSGTGLGLSISHGIIEEHKGTIRFDSQEGKGTTFVIELPYTQDIKG